ncbi:FecCD family ABC transporter permease [Larkinella rosea]|uniref:Iron ABC transporter permease n=1 Tax=Larkinella rosea TaxID=2025312 RepID=A0A3P1BPP1_9BACT|nr:iron ABC transporter permease [Larkinella rosea]RRB02494.1 iron ABC transporter permease [Larkinella rosea]
MQADLPNTLTAAPPKRSVQTGLPRAKGGWLNGLLIVLLVVVMIWSVGIGAVSIPIPDVLAILLGKIGWNIGVVEPQQETVLTVIRLPRILLGVLVGGVLGISGAAIQGLFRNPLADPGLIGISSGASVMAVLMIVLQLKVFQDLSSLSGLYALSLAAFAGAVFTTLLVYTLARKNGRTVVSTMLLVGIAINVLCESLRGLMMYLADEAQLRAISYWSMGSLGGASWDVLQVASPFLLIPILLMPRLSKSMNAFALGESQAGHLGVDVSKLKRNVIILATLGVGVAVAVSGVIGFIGLVVPHLIRQISGANHRTVLPASALLGAIVLTLSDLVARTIVTPAELPIGIITGMIGAPTFLYMLIRGAGDRA